MPKPTSCGSIAFGLVALLAAAGPLAGQGEARSSGLPSSESEGDLRRDNQRLKAQVTDLQQELDAARARIAELERQIERLAGKGAPGQTAPAPATPEPEALTIDESVASASPRALLRAMKQSYQQATADLEIGDPRTLEGERQRIAYQRAVRSWIARVHRELKGPIEWHVRIVRIIDQGDDAVLRAQAIDPGTHAVLGDPFAMVIGKSIRHRVDQLLDRDASEVLVVKGVLLPQPRMNPMRVEPGTFDKPPFLGPFAEFGFLVEASSINPAPQPPEQQDGGG